MGKPGRRRCQWAENGRHVCNQRGYPISYGGFQLVRLCPAHEHDFMHLLACNHYLVDPVDAVEGYKRYCQDRKIIDPRPVP